MRSTPTDAATIVIDGKRRWQSLEYIELRRPLGIAARFSATPSDRRRLNSSTFTMPTSRRILLKAQSFLRFFVDVFAHQG
jgi:hypothetical protein